MSRTYLRSSRQLKFYCSILWMVQTIPIFPQETKNIQQKIKNSTMITDTNTQTNQSIDTRTNQFLEYIQKKLEQKIFKTSLNPVAMSLIFIFFFLIGIYIISFVFRLFLSRYLFKRITKKIKSQNIQTELIKVLSGISPLFALIGGRLSLVSLEVLFDTNIFLIKNILNAGIIIILSLSLKRVLMSIIYIWSDQLSVEYQKVTKQLLPLVVGLSKLIIFSFALILAMSFMGINVAPFIASLGALTFAVGFAVKDSLSNFVAGVLLIIDNSFLVGDKINIPGIGFGYIHEIHLRTTRILTFDNEIIVIPNNLLMNKEYKNYRLPNETIRIVVNFSVAYGSEIGKVKKVILEILNQDSDVLDEPKPAVEFISMADFYLAFKAKGYISSFDNQYSKTIELTEKIYDQLNAENIIIPFPTHTVQLDTTNTLIDLKQKKT